jgi:hypothetical protein
MYLVFTDSRIVCSLATLLRYLHWLTDGVRVRFLLLLW